MHRTRRRRADPSTTTVPQSMAGCGSAVKRTPELYGMCDERQEPHSKGSVAAGAAPLTSSYYSHGTAGTVRCLNGAPLQTSQHYGMPSLQSSFMSRAYEAEQDIRSTGEAGRLVQAAQYRMEARTPKTGYSACSEGQPFSDAAGSECVSSAALNALPWDTPLGDTEAVFPPSALRWRKDRKSHQAFLRHTLPGSRVLFDSPAYSDEYAQEDEEDDALVYPDAFHGIPGSCCYASPWLTPSSLSRALAANALLYSPDNMSMGNKTPTGGALFSPTATTRQATRTPEDDQEIPEENIPEVPFPLKTAGKPTTELRHWGRRKTADVLMATTPQSTGYLEARDPTYQFTSPVATRPERVAIAKANRYAAQTPISNEPYGLTPSLHDTTNTSSSVRPLMLCNTAEAYLFHAESSRSSLRFSTPYRPRKLSPAQQRWFLSNLPVASASEQLAAYPFPAADAESCVTNAMTSPLWDSWSAPASVAREALEGPLSAQRAALGVGDRTPQRQYYRLYGHDPLTKERTRAAWFSNPPECPTSALSEFPSVGSIPTTPSHRGFVADLAHYRSAGRHGTDLSIRPTQRGLEDALQKTTASYHSDVAFYYDDVETTHRAVARTPTRKQLEKPRPRFTSPLSVSEHEGESPDAERFRTLSGQAKRDERVDFAGRKAAGVSSTSTTRSSSVCIHPQPNRFVDQVSFEEAAFAQTLAGPYCYCRDRPESMTEMPLCVKGCSTLSSHNTAQVTVEHPHLHAAYAQQAGQDKRRRAGRAKTSIPKRAVVRAARTFSDCSIFSCPSPADTVLRNTCREEDVSAQKTAWSAAQEVGPQPIPSRYYHASAATVTFSAPVKDDENEAHRYVRGGSASRRTESMRRQSAELRDVAEAVAASIRQPSEAGVTGELRSMKDSRTAAGVTSGDPFEGHEDRSSDERRSENGIDLTCATYGCPKTERRARLTVEGLNDSNEEGSTALLSTLNVLALARRQSGSRHLQKLLVQESKATVTYILEQAYPRLKELMVDLYGNYLCQGLFGACTPMQRIKMLETLAPDTCSIASDPRGTHAMQAFITLIRDINEQCILVRHLQPHVLHLSNHPFGTHVIQHALACFDPSATAAVFDCIIQNLSVLAENPHGVCVVKRGISVSAEQAAQAGDSRMQSALFEQLCALTLPLAQSPFGNYAIQHAIQTWGMPLCGAIIRQISDHVVELATQKFSSNVVEQVLAVLQPTEVGAILERMTANEHLCRLVNSSYGNFVVRKAFERSQLSQSVRLLPAWLEAAKLMQNKRLKAKWDKTLEAISKIVEHGRNPMSRTCADPSSPLVFLSHHPTATPKTSPPCGEEPYPTVPQARDGVVTTQRNAIGEKLKKGQLPAASLSAVSLPPRGEHIPKPTHCNTTTKTRSIVCGNGPNHGSASLCRSAGNRLGRTTASCCSSETTLSSRFWCAATVSWQDARLP